MMKRETLAEHSGDILTGASAVGMVFSFFCLMSLNTAMKRRDAASSLTCSILEDSFRAYWEQSVDIFGPRKAETVRDAVARRHIEACPVEEADIIETGLGQTLCYDTMRKRYFRSDIEKIRQAVNRLNRRGDFVSVNDLYRELRLPDIAIGDDIGWREKVDISYSSQVASDGTPVFVLTCIVGPRYKGPRHFHAL